jgi:glycosyltransferase involved in cell wall biosynthesis
LKILFVADVSIESVIGGAERVLFEQSTRLSKRGHSVHVLTRKLGNQKQSPEIINGVKEWRYDVDKKSNFTFLKTTWHNSKSLFKLLQKKYNFEIINFHQPFSSLAVIQSPLNNNAKKIYTCHSLSFEEYISRNIKPKGLTARTLFKLNVFTRRSIEKRALKKSNEIIVLSHFTQNKLSVTYNIPSQKISIIPGGVDLNRFQPSNNKKQIRQHFNIPDDKMILFSVRNLVPRMGLENLIVAIQKVVEHTKDIFLVLGGEGPLKDSLITLADKLNIKDYIHFAGFIPEKELINYYQMADIFVLPTLELEGFGLVTLEAMACGVPVLGTPVGGTQEILGKFDPNFLFEDTSSDAMTKLILEKYRLITGSPNGWSDISKRCRNFVEENYSWEKNVDSLEKIFMGTG